jgi:hypothetical protein
MINGIPVLASDRGALPEVIGNRWSVSGEEEEVIGNRLSVIGGEPTHSGGFLFHIPERYTPDTGLVPTVEELEPWVETIIRLWDDETLYRHCSEKVSRSVVEVEGENGGGSRVIFFSRSPLRGS